MNLIYHGVTYSGWSKDGSRRLIVTNNRSNLEQCFRIHNISHMPVIVTLPPTQWSWAGTMVFDKTLDTLTFKRWLPRPLSYENHSGKDVFSFSRFLPHACAYNA